MKLVGKALTAALLLALPLVGRPVQESASRMTPEEIEKLRQQRHEFFLAESEGMNEAIREFLVQDQGKVDGNQNDYDIRYYGLDLRLDFSTETISGHVDYLIQPTISLLSAVDLNLVDELSVSLVAVEGEPAIYTHASDLLSITLPSSYSQGQEFAMRVYYSGQPLYYQQHGMNFASVQGYPMCWTHCSPYAARHWWPCKDYPVDKADSVDLFFEYPADYVCVSNGVVVSDIDIGGGYKRIHYSHKYPITTYLVAVVCSDFNEHVQNWDYDTVSMPVYSYSLPTAPEAFAAFQNVCPDVLTRLSNHWGVYPFAQEKMGSAVYGWGGAMEHQTCAFYNPTFYDDWVIAHETGHQWWGDMLSACNFHHVWLKEGFASYSESIYFEDRDGPAAYFNHMMTQKYLGPGTVYVEDLVNDDIFDPNLTYDKAAWVVHMLRGVIGDSLFFEAIGNYRAAYQYSCAVTEDLSDIVSSTVGEDMWWFFDQWIYDPGNPEYEFSWSCEPAQSKYGYHLLLFIDQVQTYGAYFGMPLPVSFSTSGGQVDSVLWNDGAQMFYDIPLADSVESIDLDPQGWVLCDIDEVPMSLHMIPRQLPDGYLGIDYRVELRGIGGVPPYSWAMLGGDLPFGVVFDADSAVIKGVPSWAATYYFTLQVTDSDSPPNRESYGYSIIIHENPPYVCGDADGNEIVNVSDAVYLINYIFAGGPVPDPYESGDVDCNVIVNVSDAVYLIAYIFAEGPEPCAGCP